MRPAFKSTEQELTRFNNYRESLFAEIKKAMEIYGHWKSFEGEIALRLPGTCNQSGGFKLAVLCYVASPDDAGSQHVYRGKTLGECLDQAESDLEKWKQETIDFAESVRKIN